MTVREAGWDDLSQLLTLYAQLHDEPPSGENDVAHVWQSMLDSPGLHCFVAEQDGWLAATCTLIVVPNLTRGARPYGLIENVVTDADHRKQGLGTALLKYALKAAWGCGCYKVVLLTSRTDEAVLEFYERVGFVRGVKTGFVAKPDSV